MAFVSLSDLTPSARAAAEEYLDRVRAALADASADEMADTLEDVTTHLLDMLGPDSTARDVVAACESLGDPQEYGPEPAPQPTGTRGAGSVLGVPYDVRVPTSERVAERWWNPRDPRLFVPRVFGVGWDLNFGALAVTLHLIDPDAEDEPFALVPMRDFLIALAVPVGLTMAMAASFAILRGSLPAQLPVHWNASGEVDRYGSQATAFGFLFLLAVIPAAWAVWSVMARRSPLARGAVIGFATFLSALAAGIWAMTLGSVRTGMAPWWLVLVLIGVAGGLALGVLVFLARSGRAQEMARDRSRTASGEELS